MNLIGFLIFLVFLGIGFYKATNFSTGEIKNIKSLVLIIPGLLIWYILSSVVIIDAGDRGVIFNVFKGVNKNWILDEGLHIVPKMVNQVTIYDVYTKTLTDTISSLSSDGLRLDFDVSIRYRINSSEVANVKQHVGKEEDINNKILMPTVRSKMRDIAAKYTAQEAYASKRDQLQESYRVLLTEYLDGEKYLIPEQILIREVVPPKELVAKITETKVEEQNIIKQKNILEAEKQKKQQAIVKAEAEARALRIKGNAVANNPKIVEIEWIKAWDGHLPTTMLGGDTKVLMNMGGK